ncbi:hypothetical protein NDU88_002753 [Pleurodeles waltl]|uniref:Uncharacterized protein n=1 Tax=Pleurodeles waltl TaxID=8319 RepID=A0AAV7W4A0_PLEWA|nr:hypothetical protein NDU88_002753 [Pleurodeles waltl]
MSRFGAWYCVPNPSCLEERAVASAGTSEAGRRLDRGEAAEQTRLRRSPWFGARYCMPNPNYLEERAVASAGTSEAGGRLDRGEATEQTRLRRSPW